MDVVFNMIFQAINIGIFVDQIHVSEFALKLMIFACKMMNSVLQMLNYVLKLLELCVKNDEFRKDIGRIEDVHW